MHPDSVAYMYVIDSWLAVLVFSIQALHVNTLEFHLVKVQREWASDCFYFVNDDILYCVTSMGVCLCLCACGVCVCVCVWQVCPSSRHGPNQQLEGGKYGVTFPLRSAFLAPGTIHTHTHIHTRTHTLVCNPSMKGAVVVKLRMTSDSPGDWAIVSTYITQSGQELIYAKPFSKWCCQPWSPGFFELECRSDNILSCAMM